MNFFCFCFLLLQEFSCSKNLAIKFVSKSYRQYAYNKRTIQRLAINIEDYYGMRTSLIVDCSQATTTNSLLFHIKTLQLDHFG